MSSDCCLEKKVNRVNLDLWSKMGGLGSVNVVLFNNKNGGEGM